MQQYVVSPKVAERESRRLGDRQFQADPKKTALVVIDMQNYFVADGYQAQVPLASGLVPKINAAASALREAGGSVVWIRTTAVDAMRYWARHHNEGLAPHVAQQRLSSLDEEAEGFQLFPGLDVFDADAIIDKIKFSAFAPNSSRLHAHLQEQGIDTVVIAGVLTNVCCESTARDAMMHEYRVVMLSDGNAAMSDEEHSGALNSFRLFFGRVMSVDTLNAYWLNHSRTPSATQTP